MDSFEAYLDEMERVVRDISRRDVGAVVDVLFEAWSSGRTVYIVGNGGSASTASHMMNDLNKFTTVEDQPRFRAVALTDNVPFMTAIGNDLEYAEIFVEPMRNLFTPDDVLIAISGSGNSPNIVRAVEYANLLGAATIGLCGSPGGQLRLLAKYPVVIPSERIGQQEDGHLILNHAIATALRGRIIARAESARAAGA